MTAVAVPAARAGLQTPSNRKRLSEVTKHLVKPEGITGTGWFRVRDTCRDKLGVEFDGWQDGAGQLLLAKRADGHLAHTIGGFGMSICRQTGKTFFLAGAIFGLCIDNPGLLVIWSAHHSKTHMETFLAMQGFAQRTKIAPFIKQVFTGSGDEAIVFINGARILFGARERGFGRGIPGVDVLVSDEGQIMSIRAMQNMLATLNTSKFGLHIYAGTPPYPEDNSEVWLHMRDEALSGESTDMVWIELGADDDADLDDEKQWRKANPSIPHRTPVHAMKRLRKRIGSDIGFRHEALGIYDLNEGSVFDLARWASLADTLVAPPDEVALMIDISPDRRWSSIAVAGDVDEERTLVMVYSIKGTTDIVPKVQELLEEQNIVEVSIFGGGTARILEPALTEAGIEYQKLTGTEMSAAYGHLQEAIKAGTVCHVDQPELNFAVANTKTRYLQTGETEAFDRRGHNIDISSAVAVAGALYRWQLQKTPMPYMI